jgi:hypothetical protein
MSSSVSCRMTSTKKKSDFISYNQILKYSLWEYRMVILTWTFQIKNTMYLLFTSKARAIGLEYCSNDIMILLLPPSMVDVSIFGFLPRSDQYIALWWKKYVKMFKNFPVYLINHKLTSGNYFWRCDQCSSRSVGTAAQLCCLILVWNVHNSVST